MIEEYSPMSPHPQFRSAGRTHKGLVRRKNEDAVLALDAVKLWAVCDGLGGHAYGEIASRLIVEMLALNSNHEPTQSRQTEIGKVLRDANLELCRRNALTPRDAMGSTVAALAVDGDRFFCWWAGDSRVYRLGSNNLTRLTHDHRYVQLLLDAGELSEAEAASHPQRNVVTRAMGIEPDLTIDRFEGTVESGDTFVLITDGISACLSDDEIAQMSRASDLERAADEIVNLCLERGAPDNLSLVLVSALAA
jgi:serine/threonine protein phosphatase PrpC